MVVIKEGKIITILCLFLLLLPVVFAEEIKLTATPIKNRIHHGEWAEFNVTIHNNQVFDDIIRVYIAEEGSEWSSLTTPISDLTTGAEVPLLSSVQTKYMLKPNEKLRVDESKPYNVRLKAESAKGNNIGYTNLQIYLLPAEPVVIIYQSDIDVTVVCPEFVDPRDKYSIKIDLKNNNPKEYKNLSVDVYGKLVNKETYAELGPEQHKTIDFTLEFAPELEPQKDSITIDVKENGKLLFHTERDMEIVSYRMPFEMKKETEHKFLKTVDSITITNRENAVKQQAVKVEKSLIDSIFGKTVPEARTVKEEGKKYYVWDVKLQTGESFSVTVSRSYRSIFYILLLIALIVLGFYMFRSPITLLKQVEGIKGEEEGSINELKIVITAKNRGKKTIKDVKVLDKIPHIAGIEKKHEMGTLKPSKIAPSKTGTIIQWDIGDFEGSEERIITYNMKSKLPIVGDVRLPPSMVVYRSKGKKVKAKSNSLGISAG